MGGLARTTALSLLAVFTVGIFLTHRSLSAASARVSPGTRMGAMQAEALGQLQAQEARAAEAERLAEEAIEFSKKLRAERDAALAELAASQSATDERVETLEAKVEAFLAQPAGRPKQGLELRQRPPKREAKPPAETAPAPVRAAAARPMSLANAANPYMPTKGDPGASLAVCYEHEGEAGGRVCVEPELQYKTPTKVRWVPADPKKPGWRFHHLVENGFALHPAVIPCDSLEEADFVLYLPVSTRDPPSVPNGANKLIVLDEGDGSGFYPRVKEDSYLMYLKRSFVTKSDGAYTGTGRRYERNYFPLAYSIADSYIQPDLLGKTPRDIDILCSNRPTLKQPTRTRIVSWIHNYLEAKPSVRGIAGEVNGGNRREINTGYFGAMRRSKIVVTCNPSHWEGDFRTFEALASGALVFVDEMYVPHPRPFVDGQHVVVYDNSDEAGFAAKLDYYLARPDEAAAIAAAGLKHALTYHRAVSRLDFALRSAHELKSFADEATHPYTHTAKMIKHDTASTTQVDPIVDIGSPEFMAIQSVPPRRNVGRRFAPTKLTEDEVTALVKQNRVHRKDLGFNRRRRR